MFVLVLVLVLQECVGDGDVEDAKTSKLIANECDAQYGVDALRLVYGRGGFPSSPTLDVPGNQFVVV